MSERPRYSPEEVESFNVQRQLHQERWQKKELEYLKKMNGPFGFIYGNRYRAAESFAHSEALEENGLEFREWERNAQPVFEHMKARRDDPEGEGKKYRILILILGGGMLGPYSAGQVRGLNEVGFTADKAEVIVAASAGGGTGVYYMGGPEQTKKGGSIFYDECRNPEFINLLRLKRVLNSEVITQTMRQGEKAVDKDVIRNSPAEFYVAVTRKADQKHSELINVKTATSGGKPDVIAAVGASMNVPLFRGPGVEVNEQEYIDGSFDAMPVEEIVERFKPTDILVLPNMPFGYPDAFKEGGVTTMDTDPEKIRAAIIASARATIQAFGEKQPEQIDLYEPKGNA